VVLNNLYKTHSCGPATAQHCFRSSTALPRTLRLDQMMRYYVEHQLEVIVRAHQLPVRKAKTKRAHILRGLVRSLTRRTRSIASSGRRDGCVRQGRPDRSARHRRNPGPADPRQQMRRLAALNASASRRLANRGTRSPNWKDILAKAGAQARIRARRSQGDRRQHGDDRRSPFSRPMW